MLSPDFKSRQNSGLATHTKLGDQASKNIMNQLARESIDASSVQDSTAGNRLKQVTNQEQENLMNNIMEEQLED